MPLYQFAQFQFDSQKGCLYLDNPSLGSRENRLKNEIQLRHKVANLLSYLLEHHDRIISKDELLSELWEHGDYRENALTQSIRELRKALGDKAQQPIFIRTYPQRGYQWICELKELNSAEQNVSSTTAFIGKDKLDESGASFESLPSEIESEPEQNIVAEPIKKESESQSTKQKYFPIRIPILLAIAGCILAAVMVVFLPDSLMSDSVKASFTSEKQSNNSQAITRDSLLVLPFINATDDNNMAWLELGLSDMLAIELKRRYPLQIVSPATSNHLLLTAELTWPALPVHIRSLLNSHNLNAALFASVRLHKGQQVLDFQLIYGDGRTQQGSISYSSLPAAIPSVAQQLIYLLQPEQKKSTDNAIYQTKDPIAAQAMAEGIHNLQTQGAVQAQKYFQASSILEPDAAWTQAWQAQSELLLGRWHNAERQLADISDQAQNQDTGLKAFTSYWKSELAFRRGADDREQRIEQAIVDAEASADSSQMARSYRLRARLAWQEMQWQAHQHWLVKADQLAANSSELQTQAENLFYLGNPTNDGLEKSPDNDLRKNQKYLQKALNFYQQLGNKPMIAATQLAIAQNYILPLKQREQALEQSIALYRQLQQPYELAQALIYAGFYQMQLHQGKIAHYYFAEADQLVKQLGANNLLSYTRFYLAFSALDQGLDQSALGRHGQNRAMLEQAIVQLKNVIKQQSEPLLRTSALIFLGWAYSDLQEYDIALDYLAQAKQLNQALEMPVTFGYASYSMMRIYLEQKNYAAVIAMEDEPLRTRLQASYLARAWYEAGQPAQAVRVLQEFRQQLPALWQQEDGHRLAQYMTAKAGAPLLLEKEPAAHLVYCESDWSL